MRAARVATAATERGAVLLVVALGATALVVALPPLGAQIALLSAALLLVASLLLARAGRVLNAAWVIVLAVYLVDPLGSLMVQVESPVTMLIVAAVAPIPFALTAQWLRPEALARLTMLAPLALLLAVAVLSLAWSPDAQNGTRKLSLWIMTGLLPCAFVLVLASPERPVSWRVIAAAAFIYALTLLVLGSTSSDLYMGRLVAFGANPIWIARAAFIGALVTLFGPFPAILKVVILPPLLMAGYLTDSLGPTLGLVIGAVIGIAEVIRVRSGSNRRTGLAWTALGLGVAIGLFIYVTAATMAGPSSIPSVVDDPNVTSRALFLEVAGGMIANGPVFGAGLGAFAATGLALYPHNMFIEVASELGLVGLLCLLLWLTLAVRGAAGSPLLLSLVAATCVFALFSGSLASNAEFWLFTGVAVAMIPLRIAMPRSSPVIVT